MTNNTGRIIILLCLVILFDSNRNLHEGNINKLRIPIYPHNVLAIILIHIIVYSYSTNVLVLVSFILGLLAILSARLLFKEKDKFIRNK